MIQRVTVRISGLTDAGDEVFAVEATVITALLFTFVAVIYAYPAA